MNGFPHYQDDRDPSGESDSSITIDEMQPPENPIGVDPVDSDGGPVVYALYPNDFSQMSPREKRARIFKIASISTAVVAALVGILLLSRFAMSSMIKPQDKNAEQQAQANGGNAQQAGDEKTQAPEPKKPEWRLAGVPAANDVKELVTKHLEFDGNDCSVTAGTVDVQIVGGFVQITQTIKSESIEALGAKDCVTRAATRAAAASQALAAHAIKDSDGALTPFSEVLWIVCDETGDSYLSISFVADSTPETGDGITLLKNASRYRMSDSLYADLGLHDIPQQTAEPPVGIDGAYIYSTADW